MDEILKRHHELPADYISAGIKPVPRPTPDENVRAEAAPVIGPEQLQKFTAVLEKYNAGLKRTKSRIIASENWWKLRNGVEEQKDTALGKPGDFSSASGWLHNVLASKHADAIEAYPQPNILPREEGDRAEAQVLSSIIPVILEQNRYEKTYSDAMWSKVKYGTGVYKIVWDSRKLGGLGDIAIESANLLNLYWEPGVTDIQRSRYLFHTELVDKEVLAEQRPELAEGFKANSFVSAKFLYDDTVDTANMITVIDVYYHKGGKLHYCKYAGDQVLYATENDTQGGLASRGLYDHGLYPYVFDALFPIEGSPCGYGYVDLCKNPQTEIDLLKTAFVKNVMVNATPRFLERQEGAINEQEFLDLTKPVVHVSGATLGDDSIRQIQTTPLDDVNVAMLDRTIQELRETSGNTETSTGSVSSGVTAASAIAALQEASGKGSRDSSMASYRAYRDVISMVIELIRQFYDMPRQFRIVGTGGAEVFVTYTNARLRPQYQGVDFGQDMGYRVPTFDIKISAERQNVYTRVSQNELALQFFQLGFFNPQMRDQAMATLEIMDFTGKEQVMQKVSQNASIYQAMVQYMQMALMLARKYEPGMVAGLSQDILQRTGGTVPAVSGTASGEMPDSDEIARTEQNEPGIVANARARTAETTRPDGGRVTGKARD